MKFWIVLGILMGSAFAATYHVNATNGTFTGFTLGDCVVDDVSGNTFCPKNPNLGLNITLEANDTYYNPQYNITFNAYTNLPVYPHQVKTMWANSTLSVNNADITCLGNLTVIQNITVNNTVVNSCPSSYTELAPQETKTINNQTVKCSANVVQNITQVNTCTAKTYNLVANASVFDNNMSVSCTAPAVSCPALPSKANFSLVANDTQVDAYGNRATCSYTPAPIVKINRSLESGETVSDWYGTVSCKAPAFINQSLVANSTYNWAYGAVSCTSQNSCPAAPMPVNITLEANSTQSGPWGTFTATYNGTVQQICNVSANITPNGEVQRIVDQDKRLDITILPIPTAYCYENRDENSSVSKIWYSAKSNNTFRCEPPVFNQTILCEAANMTGNVSSEDLRNECADLLNSDPQNATGIWAFKMYAGEIETPEEAYAIANQNGTAFKAAVKASVPQNNTCPQQTYVSPQTQQSDGLTGNEILTIILVVAAGAIGLGWYLKKEKKFDGFMPDTGSKKAAEAVKSLEDWDKSG